MAPGAGWRPVKMPAGQDPWCKHAENFASVLYSKARLLLPAADASDYSSSLHSSKQDARLSDVVTEVLGTTNRGALLGAEFKIRDVLNGNENTLDDELLNEHNRSVHVIPAMKEGRPTDSSLPQIPLKLELFPSQLQAIDHLRRMEEEAQSKEAARSLTTVFRAFMFLPVPGLVQGGMASMCDAQSISKMPKDQLAKMTQWPFPVLGQVLTTPGIVTSIDVGSRSRKTVTVGWSDAGGADVFLTAPQDRFMPGFKEGCIIPGCYVRLARGDAGRSIAPTDTGLVHHLSVDGTTAVVSFPTCGRWTVKTSNLTWAPSLDSSRRVCVEIRIHVKQQVNAAMSSHSMGYGKTVLIVGLVKMSCDKAFEEGRQSSTLIIVPPKIFQQWVDEFAKWVGLTERTTLGIRLSHCNRIRLWAPVDIREFKAVPLEDAMLANVVILPHSIFASDQYPCLGVEHFNILAREWDRKVFDEFHELKNLGGSTQETLLSIKAKFCHLLSGTPQQGEGSMGAASAALLMGCSLCPNPAKSKNFPFDRDDFVKQAAAKLFDDFAVTLRSSFSVPIKQHSLAVKLSQAERVLYEEERNYGGKSVRALFERCFEFSKEGSTAYQEVAVHVKERKEELAGYVKKATSRAALIVLLAKKLGRTTQLASARAHLSSSNTDAVRFWSEGQALVDQIFARLEAMDLGDLCKCIDENDLRGDGLRGMLGLDGFEYYHSSRGADAPCMGRECRLTCFHRALLTLADRVFEANAYSHDTFSRQTWDEQRRLLGGDYVALGETKKNLDFLEKSLMDMGGGCPICLEELENGGLVCITQCGHSFHEECLEPALKHNPVCPTCRQQQVKAFSLEQTQPADPKLKYGTRVKAVVDLLEGIRASNSKDKVLLYVETRGLRLKLERAFNEFEVPFLTLSGSARAQRKAIQRWQGNENSLDFLMVLSCEEHNSGITLTTASKLVFAHVMSSRSPEEAYEMRMQALGRINRIGQTAPEIEVWDIFTEDTVEQEAWDKLLDWMRRRPPASTDAAPSKRRRLAAAAES